MVVRLVVRYSAEKACALGQTIFRDDPSDLGPYPPDVLEHLNHFIYMMDQLESDEYDLRLRLRIIEEVVWCLERLLVAFGQVQSK